MAAALVMVPAAVAAVLWLPSGYFAVAAALFLGVGSWEWAGLAAGSSPRQRGAYAILTFALMLSLFVFAPSPGARLALCAAGAAWWAGAGLWVVGAQRGRYAMRAGAAWRHWICGWLVLVPTFGALILLHETGAQGREWILVLFVFVWSADIGAYFAGRRFGRRRLASRLSPGKTWEGVLGGATACLAIGLGLAAGGSGISPPAWAYPLLGVGVALVSVIGDLLESLVKRQAGVKDSGRLIPGHGGVLDRIDSLCAAAPCFALVVAGLFGRGIPH